MDSSRLTLGLTYTLIPLLFLPLHVRILHVLLVRNEFRSLQCYRIMIQIQIFVCLMLPFYNVYGITMLSDTHLLPVTALLSDLCSSAVMAINSMDLALGLNRLKVLFEWRYPNWIDTIVQLMAWIRFFTTLVFLITTVGLNDDAVASGIDTEKTLAVAFGFWSTCIFLAHSGVTLLIYIAIAAFLLYKKQTTKSTVVSNYERPILLQAAIRFCGDSVTGVVFLATFAVDSLKNDRKATALMFQIGDLSSLLACVCFSPIVYIALNRTLRNAIFNIASNSVHRTNVT